MRFGRRDKPAAEAGSTWAEPAFGDRPTVAVVTVARNEGDMLRLWCEHYAKHVGRDSLLIFDDNSTDGSMEKARAAGYSVHHIPGFPGGRDFEQARIALVSGIASGLLHVYDYVVFADADEFLVPDPTLYADLPAFLGAHREDAIIAGLGLNVVHAVNDEDPLDLSRPILEQRSYASFAPLMCKPAAKRVPAPWSSASHGIRAPYRVDPGLFMLHLKFADADRLAAVAGERHAASQADGRAGKSSWGRPANELVRALRNNADAAAVAAAQEFDPAAVDLAALVLREDKLYRAPRIGQLASLRNDPIVRIPSRLRGSL